MAGMQSTGRVVADAASAIGPLALSFFPMISASPRSRFARWPVMRSSTGFGTRVSGAGVVSIFSEGGAA